MEVLLYVSVVANDRALGIIYYDVIFVRLECCLFHLNYRLNSTCSSFIG